MYCPSGEEGHGSPPRDHARHYPTSTSMRVIRSGCYGIRATDLRKRPRRCSTRTHQRCLSPSALSNARVSDIRGGAKISLTRGIVVEVHIPIAGCYDSRFVRHFLLGHCVGGSLPPCGGGSGRGVNSAFDRQSSGVTSTKALDLVGNTKRKLQFYFPLGWLSKALHRRLSKPLVHGALHPTPCPSPARGRELSNNDRARGPNTERRLRSCRPGMTLERRTS